MKKSKFFVEQINDQFAIYQNFNDQPYPLTFDSNQMLNKKTAQKYLSLLRTSPKFRNKFAIKNLSEAETKKIRMQETIAKSREKLGEIKTKNAKRKEKQKIAKTVITEKAKERAARKETAKKMAAKKRAAESSEQKIIREAKKAEREKEENRRKAIAKEKREKLTIKKINQKNIRKNSMLKSISKREEKIEFLKTIIKQREAKKNRKQELLDYYKNIDAATDNIAKNTTRIREKRIRAIFAVKNKIKELQNRLEKMQEDQKIWEEKKDKNLNKRKKKISFEIHRRKRTVEKSNYSVNRVTKAVEKLEEVQEKQKAKFTERFGPVPLVKTEKTEKTKKMYTEQQPHTFSNV